MILLFIAVTKDTSTISEGSIAQGTIISRDYLIVAVRSE
jgi:hypothetical protein